MQVNLAPVEPSRSGRQSTGDPQEQRQHRLEEIYGTLPVGLAYHDRELRYVYVNEYLANLNGKPAAEHAGRSFREMAPPAVADYAEPLLVRVLETGVPLVDWEVSLPDLKHKERTRDWLIQYHPVRESGVVTGVYSIVQEITEHRQMERLLESNEELFRATFEQTSVGIAHVGLNGNWLRVNQRVCEITGYKEEELLHLSYHDITHPDDRVLEDELGYKNLVAGKVQRYSLEKRCVRKDGKIAWVYVTGSLMRDSTGKPLYEIAVIEDISARKRAEAELAEGKERLQAALDASMTGTFRWNIRGGHLDFDPNLDRLFGLAQGKTVRSLEEFIAMVHPEDRERVVHGCELCAAQGADFEMEFRVVWPEGSVHWIYDRGKTFLDQDDRPEYMTGACVDVTERKAAQAALNLSQERLRLALQSGDSGIFDWDILNDTIFWSEEIESIYGFASGKLPGNYMAWRECVHRDDLAQAETAIGEAIATGNFATEFRIIRSDTGKTRWMGARGKVLADEMGRPARMLGINVDITERKKVEEQLRRAAQILDQIHDAVIATDLAGHITLWNKGAERRFGYAAEEAMGRALGFIYRPEDKEFVQGNIIIPTQHHGTHELEVRNITKDGREFYGHLSLSMLNDEAGRPIGIIGYTMDVTERKQAESALRLSEKLAATGRLASTLAHEINNPLAAVTNVIFLLRSDPAIDTLAGQHLRTADTEIRRVSHITRKLLSFHREPTRPIPVDLASILQEVVELYEPKLERKELQVQSEFAGVPAITAYPGEMRQVFSNLIDNAIEASRPAGRLRLRVVARRKSVRVLVADNGPGIAREHLSKIFEPFFTTKGEKGTGLGLWITRDLISKHKGHIRVRTGNHGTCFVVELPMDENRSR